MKLDEADFPALTVDLFPIGPDAASSEARLVEHDIFFDAFGDTPEEIEREFSPYESRSAFLTVARRYGGEVLGFSRLIFPSEDGAPLKSTLDIDSGPWGVSATEHLRSAGLKHGFDIPTIGVRPEARRLVEPFLVARCLFHGIFSIAMVDKYDYAIGVLDITILRYLRSYGLPIDVIGHARAAKYLGSTRSLPCVFNSKTVLTAIRQGRVQGGIDTGHGLRERVRFEDSVPTPLRVD